MHVVGVAPLEVGSLVWQERGGVCMTVVCKATYRLLQGNLELAAEREPIRAEDAHVDGDEAKSLLAPSDLVPRKARADITLVGHAYAARGVPVRSLVARITLGPVDKEVEVFCDRSWTHDGTMREGGRFKKMLLSYERAAGGPATANPVGVRTGPAAQPDAQGAVSLPNLQPVGGAPASRRDPVQAVGFGPIPASFPERMERLARHATGVTPAQLLDAPLPDDLDFAYFNAAPKDQQLPVLRGGEHLVLQNLHREHARLLTTLPTARPRVFAERAGTAPREVVMRCDALWIDTNRGICALTWRGELPLASRDERGRVICAMEEASKRLAFDDVLALVGPEAEGGQGSGAAGGSTVRAPAEPRASGILPPAASSPAVQEPLPLITSALMELERPPAMFAAPPMIAMPPAEEAQGPGTVAFQAGPTDTLPAAFVATSRVAIFQPPGDALPFTRDAGPSPLARSTGEPPPLRPRSHTLVAPAGQVSAGPAWLAAAVPPAPPPPSPPTPPPPAPSPSPVGAGPAWLAAAPPPTPPPPRPSSPPAGGGPAWLAAAPSPTPPPVAPSSPPAGGAPAWLAAAPPPTPLPPRPSSPPAGGGPAWLAAAPPSTPHPPAPPSPPAGGGPAWLAAASPSAPSSPPAAPRFGEPPQPSPREPSWANLATRAGRSAATPAAVTPPKRRHDVSERDAIDLLWADLDAAPRILGAFGDLLDDKAPPDPEETAAERSEDAVVRVLASGRGCDALGLEGAIAGAVGPDGRFRAPVVLVAGELSVPFDELETLRATLAAARPLATGDRRLREALDAVDDLLATPGLEPASGVIDHLLQRVRDALAQGGRAAPPLFGAQVERLLLERRAYQRRALLGEDHLRALVTLPGGETACPVYLPDALSNALPMFPAFEARILAEAHLAQDGSEAHAAALEVLAIGRVLPGRRRGR